MVGIDGARAIAVTMVVIFHIYAFGSGSPEAYIFGLDLRPWLATGFVGVDLFFVLSGFQLILPWTRGYYKSEPVPSVREFYRRRIFRIVPAYYFHLLVLFLVMVPIAYSTTLVFSPLGLFTALAHLSFVQYMFPQTSASFGINGALWTLTIEASFYFALPFVARFFLGWRALIGLIAALVIVQVWLCISFHHLFGYVSWVLSKLGTYKYDQLVIQRFLALQFSGQVFYFAIGMAIANLAFCCKTDTFRWYLTSKPLTAMTIASIACLAWVMWFGARQGSCRLGHAANG